MMAATIGLVLDCDHPERLAEFWSGALGYTTLGGAGSYVADSDPSSSDRPVAVGTKSLPISLTDAEFSVADGESAVDCVVKARGELDASTCNAGTRMVPHVSLDARSRRSGERRPPRGLNIVGRVRRRHRSGAQRKYPSLSVAA
jgi:hypothetical protein